MSVLSYEGCLYMYKIFFLHVYIFTFYAFELRRILHVYYIASFSMNVDEWINYANFRRTFLLRDTCYTCAFSVINLLRRYVLFLTSSKC